MIRKLLEASNSLMIQLTSVRGGYRDYFPSYLNYFSSYLNGLTYTETESLTKNAYGKTKFYQFPLDKVKDNHLVITVATLEDDLGISKITLTDLTLVNDQGIINPFLLSSFQVIAMQELLESAISILEQITENVIVVTEVNKKRYNALVTSIHSAHDLLKRKLVSKSFNDLHYVPGMTLKEYHCGTIAGELKLSDASGIIEFGIKDNECIDLSFITDRQYKLESLGYRFDTLKLFLSKIRHALVLINESH